MSTHIRGLLNLIPLLLFLVCTGESGAMQVTAAGDTTQRRAGEKITADTALVKTAAEIQNLPVRGYVDVARLNPGVVQRFGALFIRGGRFEETGYYVDGVSQNNFYDFSRAGDLISNSLAEVRLLPGGFDAEYGFFNSGLIQATTKTGGSEYALSGEIITDEFLREEEKNLGAFSYGYNLYNLTLSGPLPMTDKIKFYLAGERQFWRDQNPTSGRHPELANQIPRRVEGPLPNNSLGRWNWNGNLVAEFHPLQLRLGGHSTRDDARVYLQEFAMFNAARMPRLEEQTDSYYLKAGHELGTKTFYTITASYFRNEFEFGDNVWFDNLEAYGDISRNPQLRAPGVNPAVSDFEARFAKAGTVFNSYQRHQFTVWNLQAAFNHKAGNTHNLQAGVDYRYNTIRLYSIAPFNIAQTRAANPALSDEDVYFTSFAQNIGYDLFGKKELDAGRNGAKHPVLAAAYLQDRLGSQNFVINFGLRWDYFDPATLIFRDPLLIVFDPNGRIAERVYRDASGRYASGAPTPQDQTGVSQLIEAKTHSRLNPRVNMAFAVTDRTVLRAQFGKFTQPPEFNLLATNYGLLGNILLGGGLAASNSNLKPIGTTAYEIGLRQQLGDNAGLDAAFFYKTTRDLIALQSANAIPVPYSVFVNEEESTAKGLAMTVYWRPRRGISTNVAYTLQSAAGTDVVNTFSNINWLGNPPIFPTAAAPTTATPLAFDQRHTLILNADFRFAKGEGPRWLGIRPFSELGLNVLLTYGNGFPYTPALARSVIFSTGPGASDRPVAEINSARTPATYSLDAKLDKSFTLAGVRWNVYLWTINLLGRKNVVNVYDQTGEPDDDGFLQTPSGMEFAALDPTGNAAAYYRARISNPFNFGAPRQLRLGLRFEIK